MMVAHTSGSACLHALGWSGVGSMITRKRCKAANRRASFIVSLATAHTNPSTSVEGGNQPSWFVCKGDSSVHEMVFHSLAWSASGVCTPSSAQTQEVDTARRNRLVLSVLFTRCQCLFTDSHFCMYILLGVNAGLLVRSYGFYPLNPCECNVVCNSGSTTSQSSVSRLSAWYSTVELHMLQDDFCLNPGNAGHYLIYLDDIIINSYTDERLDNY